MAQITTYLHHVNLKKISVLYPQYMDEAFQLSIQKHLMRLRYLTVWYAAFGHYLAQAFYQLPWQTGKAS
ncbi:hypothetical protein CODIS_36420 [Candidatus Thiodiazotropha endolucinida]|uniref:Uncharacterized protein n=1 Tax=Candidatus Thiodiazotropha endolucinida TaxID=1655433 RepID=A0A7Z0VIC5_9GAMM|nr:hypothetical protein CODIS_36420 [Candidatus Thiodiazotropha endolucinida]